MVLTRTDVVQILDEREVYKREPDAMQQHLEDVILAIGERRANVFERESRLEDGVFAGWAICLPGYPQPRKYSDFMKSIRRDRFAGVPREEAGKRAAALFPSKFLSLGLHEIEALVTSETGVEEVEKYLSLEGKML